MSLSILILAVTAKIGVDVSSAPIPFPENYNGVYCRKAEDLSNPRFLEVTKDQGAKFIQFRVTSPDDPNLGAFLGFAKANGLESVPMFDAYAAPFDFELEDEACRFNEWNKGKEMILPYVKFSKAHPEIRRFVYDQPENWHGTYLDRYKMIWLLMRKYCPGLAPIAAGPGADSREYNRQHGDLDGFARDGDVTALESANTDARFVWAWHRRFDDYARSGASRIASDLQCHFGRRRDRGTDLHEQLLRVSYLRNADMFKGETINPLESVAWSLRVRKFLLSRQGSHVVRTKLLAKENEERVGQGFSWSASFDRTDNELRFCFVNLEGEPQPVDIRFTKPMPAGKIRRETIGEGTHENDPVQTAEEEFAGGKVWTAEVLPKAICIYSFKTPKGDKSFLSLRRKKHEPPIENPVRAATNTTYFANLKKTFPAQATAYDLSKLKMERLGRGTVAVRKNEKEAFVTWRYLSSDPRNAAFDVYKDGRKITKEPVRNVTYLRVPYTGRAKYVVKGLHEKRPRAGSAWTIPADAPVGYVQVDLTPPPPGKVLPPCRNAGEEYSYLPEDCSIGDADGDGEMELFVKWAPTNGRDNSHGGATGPTMLACVKISTGKELWRANLGTNIRSGSHYLPFMVYDFDGDGKAELICRTADGTVDGTGKVWGDPTKDWREEWGQVVKGPLWTSVFNGETGAIMAQDEWPDVFEYDWRMCRGNGWGDRHDMDGNRPFRFLSAIAWLDGVHPSVVMCRGYYSRTILHAYSWDGKELKTLWRFDTSKNQQWDYCSQGFHNLRVGDVDMDGKDEIVYGQMVVDDDGTGLYSTKMGHGDMINLVQLTPERPGLQVFTCQENGVDGCVLREAGTGEVIWQQKSRSDVPRALAGDVDGDSYGTEFWAPSGIGIKAASGRNLRWPKITYNFLMWWDGDLARDCYGGVGIFNFSVRAGRGWGLQSFEGTAANHTSKCVPCFSGDMFGDWREEVVQRTEDNRAIRLYVSTEPTKYRFHTFLEDPVYRSSVATQNCGYNVCPQPGFYFGPDLLGHGIWFRGTYCP